MKALEHKENEMKARLQRRVRVASVTIALAAMGAPAAQAQGERFIPGYTDFPNALRVDRTPADAGRYAPGHTDFPNHLRVESVYDRARANVGADEPVVIAASDARGFDWTDAGVGAGGAAAVLLLGAVVAALTVRRPVRRAALTG